MTPTPSSCYCFNPYCVASYSWLAATCQECGALLQLGQRYRAIQLLGQGHFSRTFLAMDQVDAIPVVIQQRWNLVDDPALVTRLRRVGLHPQLPTVLNAFEQTGCQYLVQEYIKGKSLARAIAARQVFDISAVWQILESILPILDWLHSHDLIHRDLKPENILYRPSDLALVDLGSVMLSSEQTQTAIGSPEYTAPEQLRGAAVFASDLYSLGVVCIHLLTGVQPFHLFDMTENRWIWRSYWQPDQLSSASEGDRLAQILNRLIDPIPIQRFGSAAAAIAAIEQLRGKKIPIPTPLPRLTWQNPTTFVGHAGLFASVTAVALAPNQPYLASASEDKTVRLWDLERGNELGVLQGHQQFVQAVAFHPAQASQLISAGRDRQILLWNWQTQQILHHFVGHTQAVNAIAISPDGSLLASGSADKTIKLWRLTGELTSTLSVHRLAVNAVAFHPTLPQLASASADGTVCLWNLAGDQLQTLTGHTQAVRAIAFSPTGQLLASGGEDKTIRLWDVASGQCLQVLAGHPWSVAALAFASHDVLISGSWDRTLKVWQLSTGEEIGRLVGHRDSVTSLALQVAPTSGLRAAVLVSGSRDRTLKRWQFAEA